MTRICAPHTLPWRAALCVGVLALSAASGAAATGRDDGAYRQARDGAKAMYDAQRKQCRGMSGHAKDVCVAQAKANRVRAEAKADVTYKAGDRTRLVAARVAAKSFTVDSTDGAAAAACTCAFCTAVCSSAFLEAGAR